MSLFSGSCSIFCFWFSKAEAVVLRCINETTDLILARMLWTSLISSALPDARFNVWAKQPIWIGILAVCAAIFILAALSVVSALTLQAHSIWAWRSTFPTCSPVCDSGSCLVWSTLEQSSISELMKWAVIVTYDSVALLVQESVVHAVVSVLRSSPLTRALTLSYIRGITVSLNVPLQGNT